jgi:hypothetical protein
MKFSGSEGRRVSSVMTSASDGKIHEDKLLCTTGGYETQKNSQTEVKEIFSPIRNELLYTASFRYDITCV